ncbi:MAG: His/Gly/Thr/Pro-type tRNA ligase C-terminal domain-containing protein [Candidatus Pacebacteria bacterium]|nr:His/Gly/Thr/Pro-type tRNA ligase C-terminal domain-containing protein [Candidatus Paceibacterota bacterium]
MKLSQLFTKTAKEAPADADSVNARLLTQAGFIQKQMAGVYNFLPLGLRVLNKIENIIREEMNAIGGQEMVMPALTQEESWQKTGRASLDILFHLQGQNDAKMVLNPTHEEVITPMMKRFIASYRDLPFAAYQFQVKFRNEARAKSGILRGREFPMKDLYSFHADEKDLDDYYEKVKAAYFKIYERVGLGEKTILTFASGGAFSKYSHEFQTFCEVGEDTIHLCEKCRVAVNADILQDQNSCPECGNKQLKPYKAVEVGNIFKLRTKFSEPFGLTYKDAKGQDHLVEMGCYGIGLSRLMGIIADIFNDDKGLMWPESVAPYKVHLIALENEPGVAKSAQKAYKELKERGIEVLFDDRPDVSAGEKFADADLIGLPIRVVVSKKTLQNKSVEIKGRHTDKMTLVGQDKLLKAIED